MSVSAATQLQQLAPAKASEPFTAYLCRAWADQLKQTTNDVKLSQPLTIRGIPYLCRLPAMKKLELSSPFLDSSISRLPQLTAVIFAPAASYLPLQRDLAYANLAVLQSLVNLRQLELVYTYLPTIQPLAALTQLQSVKLDSCRVSLAHQQTPDSGDAAWHLFHVRFDIDDLDSLASTQQQDLPLLTRATLQKGLAPCFLRKVSGQIHGCSVHCPHVADMMPSAVVLRAVQSGASQHDVDAAASAYGMPCRMCKSDKP